MVLHYPDIAEEIDNTNLTFSSCFISASNLLDRVCSQHTGSKRFRKIIEQHRRQYQEAPTKFEKMAVTRTLYENLKRTNRFLKLNEETGLWEDISALAARDKVGHALRFANRGNKNSKKSTSSAGSTISRSSNTTNTKSQESSPVCVKKHPAVNPSDALQHNFQLVFEPDEEAFEQQKDFEDNNSWDSLVDHLQNSFPLIQVDSEVCPVSRNVFEEVNTSMTAFHENFQETTTTTSSSSVGPLACTSSESSLEKFSKT